MSVVSVQAIHAALESARTFPQPDEHPHLVLIGVPDEPALCRAAETMADAGIDFAPFWEPDLGNALTAIATPAISGATRSHFRKYHLLNQGE